MMSAASGLIYISSRQNIFAWMTIVLPMITNLQFKTSGFNSSTIKNIPGTISSSTLRLHSLIMEKKEDVSMVYIPILMISNHFHPQRAVKLEPRTATKDIRQQELICWANLKTEKEYEE